ncbi:hypothetical protein RBSH_05640 [Rhodopirellula baltica SH28]|uniref:Uncharacterized protein n=1 Tax=Rhodopirellula baltica SH28 TaxID=993517 RepID=K5D8C6_RHOBT|nr:hypothetical protein RBSH_05640 [Rhodopirellula baltica SH28]
MLVARRSSLVARRSSLVARQLVARRSSARQLVSSSVLFFDYEHEHRSTT